MTDLTIEMWYVITQPTRFKICNLLLENINNPIFRPHAFNIAKIFKLSISKVSTIQFHLSKLEQSKVVTSKLLLKERGSLVLVRHYYLTEKAKALMKRMLVKE